MVKEYLPL